MHPQTQPLEIEASDRSETTRGLPLLPSPIALAELAFAFALIYGLDWLSPQLGILDMQPHPFWIPVLMLGLQYGTVNGLVAAGAAIAATVVGGLPEAGIGENHFAYFLRAWGQPILWIAVALLVGQFRMRQIAAKQELRRISENLVRQRDDLARHASGLSKRCERLERELAARREAQPQRALALLKGASATGAGAERIPLSSIVESAFPGGRARLYRLDDGALTEHRDADGAAEDLPRRMLSRGHPLVIAVASGNASRSVLDADGEKMLDGLGLMAVPVHGADGQRVVGALVLEEGSASALSADGIAALELIAVALAPRLEGAEPHQPSASAASGAGEAPAPIQVQRSGLRLVAQSVADQARPDAFETAVQSTAASASGSEQAMDR